MSSSTSAELIRATNPTTEVRAPQPTDETSAPIPTLDQRLSQNERTTAHNAPGLAETQAPSPMQQERSEDLEKVVTEEQEEPKAKPSVPRMIPLWSWLIFFSIWGALARLGLSALEDYQGAPVFYLIWAQFTGCVIIGFLSQDKTIFLVDDRYTELYTGLTTGFCGSITSFSSWMLGCFAAMANVRPIYDRPNSGYNVMALLAQVIITLSVSMAALRFGAMMASLAEYWLAERGWVQVRGARKGRDARNILAIILAIGCWAGAAILVGLVPKWRGVATFAALFAPLGTLTRFYLARLNPKIKSFPVGTFAANMLGTLILAILLLLQHRTTPGHVGCQALQGVGDGYCGCLTTVSTFVLELSTLRRRHAWKYGAVSIEEVA
ncbi:hypothetical protein YB2330_004270 [Saitoella coloradoensis]